MTGDALATLTRALEDHGRAVNGNSAQCPAHDDRSASLSIGQGRDGALVRCHAGCETDAVLESLGMSAADLFDEPAGRKAGPIVIATYTYTDEHGHPLFYCERRVPKDFRQYQMVDGAKVWHLRGARRVLYRLPEVIDAVGRGETVHVVEGEADVHAVEAAGGVATCNPMGAGKWRDEYAGPLKGADVVIVADRDDTGRKHAEQVRASLTGVAASVRVVEAASGKDASDHLAAGHGLDDFAAVGAAGQDEADAEVDALIAELLDTGDLDHIPALEPLIADVLYLDTVARMWGESGALKSFMALDFAASVGTGTGWHGRPVRQGLVIYLVAEGVKGIRRRVRAWEQHHGREMTGVKFLPRPVQVKSPEWPVLITACQRLRPALIVVDTQARVTVGVEENSATEMGVVLDMVERLRAASGACVLLVHHTGLNGERGRGSTAIKGGMQTELGVSRSGKHLPDIRVTLKTGKQKDDEELGDLVFTVRRIALRGEAKPDGSPVTSLVLVPGTCADGPVRDPRSAQVSAQLDALNIPVSAGRTTVRKALARTGIKIGDALLSDLIRERKTCAAQAAHSSAQPEAVLFPPSLEGEQRTGAIADGHLPGCDKQHNRYGTTSGTQCRTATASTQ